MLTQTLLVAFLAAPVAVTAADPPTRNGTQTAQGQAGDRESSNGNGARRQPIREREHDLLVRRIAIKQGLPSETARGGFDKPLVIDNDDELERVIRDKTLQTRLKHELNFDKHKLVLFAWSGSGGDKLDYKVEKKNVTFQLKPGVTKDLRPHHELFAIAKDAQYRVEKPQASGKNKKEENLDRVRQSEQPGRS